MLKIEGRVSGLDTRTKENKTTFLALLTDGMESYKISSEKPFGFKQDDKVAVNVRANEYKGVIYYQAINMGA